jgi:hypothetical protein
MKYIQKSRIETFLKIKGYNVNDNEQKLKDAICWSKSDKEKIIVPKEEIIQSTELPYIFTNVDLLKEFGKY